MPLIQEQVPESTRISFWHCCDGSLTDTHRMQGHHLALLERGPDRNTPNSQTPEAERSSLTAVHGPVCSVPFLLHLTYRHEHVHTQLPVSILPYAPLLLHTCGSLTMMTGAAIDVWAACAPRCVVGQLLCPVNADSHLAGSHDSSTTKNVRAFNTDCMFCSTAC